MAFSLAQDTEALQGGGASFVRDRWERNPSDPNAGYGITAVMEGGPLLEKVTTYPLSDLNPTVLCVS